MSRHSSSMAPRRLVLLAGTISTRAPSWTATTARAGCQASLQISTATRPMSVSNARMAFPGVKCLRSSQMSYVGRYSLR